MELHDPSQIYLAVTSTKGEGQGSLHIWNQQVLTQHKECDLPPWELADEVSHRSPVKALSWNPKVKGLLATGGSSAED